MLNVTQKIEKTIGRIERMRQFRKAFEARHSHVFHGREDVTVDSMRYCDAMIQSLEGEIVRFVSGNRCLIWRLGPEDAVLSVHWRTP